MQPLQPIDAANLAAVTGGNRLTSAMMIQFSTMTSNLRQLTNPSQSQNMMTALCCALMMRH